MAASCTICAHDNEFNKSVLNNNAFFFSNANDISETIDANNGVNRKDIWIDNNIDEINAQYSMEKIINKYYNLISQ